MEPQESQEGQALQDNRVCQALRQTLVGLVQRVGRVPKDILGTLALPVLWAQLVYPSQDRQDSRVQPAPLRKSLDLVVAWVPPVQQDPLRL